MFWEWKICFAKEPSLQHSWAATPVQQSVKDILPDSRGKVPSESEPQIPLQEQKVLELKRLQQLIVKLFWLQ